MGAARHGFKSIPEKLGSRVSNPANALQYNSLYVIMN
jgi:hypothetical protein